MLVLEAHIRLLPPQVTVASVELACLAADRAGRPPHGLGSLIGTQAEELAVDGKRRSVPGYELVEDDAVIVH